MVDQATNETIRTGAVGYMCDKKDVDSICHTHALIA